jgi:prepilin-type N-terminal cleavage/methylation domain-containing protein/prepilin-type processing-associated H-X9-DG protein
MDNLKPSLTKKYFNRRAFTLIELLVVISVIALLMSILMPSLSKVKQLARLTICAADQRQVGLYASIFQAENNGQIPVILNQYDYRNTPVENCMLSLALRQYDPELKKLPDHLDPTTNWDDAKYFEYLEKYIPDHYLCPTIRNKSVDLRYTPGTVTISGESFTTMRNDFREESYGTFHWKREKGEPYSIHPSGLPHGSPKYPELPWYNSTYQWDHSKTPQQHLETLKNMPNRWKSSTAKSLGGFGLSTAVVVFCTKGQFDGYMNLAGGAIYNYGKHPKKGTGGTNALFADGHIEWVEGSRIGWP